MGYVAGQGGHIAEHDQINTQMVELYAKDVAHDAALAALPATYATVATAATKAESASIEDLFTTVTMQTLGGVWTNTAGTSAPMFVAPFPLTITSIAMLSWFGATIALSDTAYWSIDVRKGSTDGATTTVIATKSTKTTAGSGVPSGSAWPSRIAWKYDTSTFANATLAAGESVSLATYPTGTPVTLGVPMTITIGYRPL